jgi:hypothetical protein
MFDTMRGFTTGNESNARLRANTSEAEGTNTNYGATSTGFVDNLSNSNTYIYIAIRRGPMKTPESGTEVFAMDEGDATDLGIKTGILTDALILGQRSGSDKYYFGSRLTGTKYLRTNTTAAEATQANQVWDRMDGAWDNNLSSYTGWGFRRAPGFFDVVAYTGNSSTNVISHNLQATPELIIIKKRNASVGWIVWWSTASTNHYLTLDTSNASANFGATWIQDIDSDSFTVLGGYGYNNTNLDDYIAYLFATVPGVSKVGSFSHTNGSTTDVDCGFSSGARFVLIKRTSATGPWALWDSERGIISGTEKYLALDSTAAETDDGGIDYIDPLSSGFQMTGSLSTADYIFLAIA